MKQTRFINPSTDFGFKKLFGTEFNKDLLIDFLNQVLGEREQIEDLTYLNSEKQGSTQLDRKSIFDLYCENERGEKFIVEVQNVYQKYFKDRSLYYATTPIREQAVRGKGWDYQLKAVYTVSLLNFSFPEPVEPDRYWREVKLMDTAAHEIFYDKLTFFYLEIDRFNKPLDELETRFEQWVYLLKNLHQLEEIPEKLRDRIFVKLFNQAEVANLTKQEMEAYDESEKVYWDNYAVIKSTKEIAEQEGIQKGMQEGIEQGIQKGMQATQLAIAKEMKKKNMSVDIIAETTKLAKEQIEAL